MLHQLLLCHFDVIHAIKSSLIVGITIGIALIYRWPKNLQNCRVFECVEFEYLAVLQEEFNEWLRQYVLIKVIVVHHMTVLGPIMDLSSIYKGFGCAGITNYHQLVDY